MSVVCPVHPQQQTFPHPVTELDDETRAGVASFEIDERGHVTKIKLWDRLRAIEMAMKHTGLFERDNQQKKDNIAIQINLVD
jgi:hypothetical protein